MDAKALCLKLMEDCEMQSVIDMIFSRNELVDVRDKCTRAKLTLKAWELSVYRHTLFLNGRAYRILNIVS